MDAAIRAVLADYEARIAREAEIAKTLAPAEFGQRRDEFLLPVGPETAQLMDILIRARKPRTLVEVGTSFGYSTVWLAAAARATGATLHTLELAQHKSDHARDNIARAGLADHVVFHVGDARSLLAALPGPFDFVLLDLWKDLYIPCFDLMLPKLSPGAFVIADNMLEPIQARAHAEAYRQHVRTRPGISSVLLPVGSGIEITRFDPA
jgi:predicted O-methyltransferase YrrM